MKKIKHISTKPILKSKWYNVDHDKVILASGKRGDYYVVRTKGSVAIIALTKNNQIILTKQFRYPSNKFSIELPSGGMKTSNHKRQALEELEEETGYKAKTIKKIAEFYPMNGISSELCHVYIAKNLSKSKQNLDDTEDIQVIKKPLKEAYKIAEQNKFTDGFTIVALFLAKKYLKKYL